LELALRIRKIATTTFWALSDNVSNGMRERDASLFQRCCKGAGHALNHWQWQPRDNIDGHQHPTNDGQYP